MYVIDHNTNEGTIHNCMNKNVCGIKQHFAWLFEQVAEVVDVATLDPDETTDILSECGLTFTLTVSKMILMLTYRYIGTMDLILCGNY